MPIKIMLAIAAMLGFALLIPEKEEPAPVVKKKKKAPQINLTVNVDGKGVKVETDPKPPVADPVIEPVIAPAVTP
jgi:hypothetical protein